MPRLNSPEELERLVRDASSRRDSARPCVSICAGTGCLARGAGGVIAAFERELVAQGLAGEVDLKRTGCHGFCEKTPVVVIHPEETCYVEVKAEDVPEIVSRTLGEKKIVDRLLFVDPATGARIGRQSDIPFYRNQHRLLIGSHWKVAPTSIEDYFAVGGYSALATVLRSMTPQEVIAQVKASGLRGLSGGGFPAGRKWEAGRRSRADVKYVVCNCHEGDPGAFVDRMMMEANPHAMLEGMLIGAYAVGAAQGYVFVGGEWPQAVENAVAAVEQARDYGLLGDDILGSGFGFAVKMSIDGGGYVCGESTALTASLEGRVGEPIKKYDHATERGLWGRPTVLNNLQTWMNVPRIINQGAAAYASVGTAGSKGTRVFSLSGAVANSGLVEVPMGTTLRRIVFDIGGGVRGGGNFKALQVGGPLGGFVPEGMLDLRVDFDELSQVGLSPGPALVVLDQDTCIVDMVRYFFGFVADESCGKCTPCREGLRQMVKIVNRACEGAGREGDIDLLEELAELQRDAALCALGQGASGPALAALRHFRDEFDAHVKDRRCPAGVCAALSGTGRG